MKVAVQSKAGECDFECNDGDTLLRAGLAAGVTLPYECATGTCGSCRARLVKGDVDVLWADAPGLSKIKRDKGDILMCQSRPRSDCELRIAANVTIENGTRQSPVGRKGIIRGVQLLTHDVVAFNLELSSRMSFEAGQFVTIEAQDVPGPRAYSMANYEPDAPSIDLIVKRKPGGGFSDWLFADAEGEEVDVFGPLGHATFRAGEDRNVLCIAGGSGIAGIISILDCATRAGHFRKHKGYVYFGVRTLADAFYLEELSYYVNASRGGLEVVLAFSHENVEEGRCTSHPALKVAAGLVHEVAAQSMVGRYDNVIAYIAGPVPMVDGAIRVLIADGGLSSDQIRYDKFS